MGAAILDLVVRSGRQRMLIAEVCGVSCHVVKRGT